MPKVRIANVFDSLSAAHQFEVRSVSEMVITDLFRNILNSEETIRYTEEVLEEAYSRDLQIAKKTRGLAGTLGVEGDLGDPKTRISGNPIYGMFFEELGISSPAVVPRAGFVGEGQVPLGSGDKNDSDGEG